MSGGRGGGRPEALKGLSKASAGLSVYLAEQLGFRGLGFRVTTEFRVLSERLPSVP